MGALRTIPEEKKVYDFGMKKTTPPKKPRENEREKNLSEITVNKIYLVEIKQRLLVKKEI